MDVMEVDEGSEAEEKDGNGGETKGREDVLDSVPHGWLPGSFNGTMVCGIVLLRRPGT